MSVLMVPPLDARPYPTLGPQVAAFMEAYLVHGPGDLRGQPYRLDDEKRALLCRMYEVFPPGHPQAGRRRFRRVALSLRKGSAKTEFAAMIAACELHPDGPVRCVGWDEDGNPIGGPVTDPYIPMVAYTEEQSDELAYAALYVAISEGPLADDFDIGLRRVMRKGGDGKAESLATAPDSRDGARTTFQVFDETHRLSLPRQKQAHRTMLANLPKRQLADPWALETTTAPAPGEGSVAEDTMEYARAVHEGRVSDAKLFFFHRQASDDHDLTTPEGVRAAVIEASGPIAAWSDLDGIVEQWQDPTADKAYLERVWLNRLVSAAEAAFDLERFKGLADPHEVPDGELITLGFDGSRYYDATGIVATQVATGYQWVIGCWERPFGRAGDGWEVPEDEVDAAMAEAFRRWQVWRLYADPPYWETNVAKWSGEYGHERVIAWRTNQLARMAPALKSFHGAIATGELTHDGDERYQRHIGNACRKPVNVWDEPDEKGEPGKRLWVVTKQRSDSPHKIDLSVAGCLSWEARRDALAAGALNDEGFVYDERPMIFL